MSDSERERRSHRPSPSPRATASNAAHAVKPKTAVEAQKASLERLFKDPTKEVYIPAPPKPKTLSAPRDIIPNVQGSSAGAGEFGRHLTYRMQLRRVLMNSLHFYLLILHRFWRVSCLQTSAAARV
jgi:hypothetical protein